MYQAANTPAFVANPRYRHRARTAIYRTRVSAQRLITQLSKETISKHLRLGEALNKVAQVGQALAYAHKHDIFHGNIKPENILLGADGQVFLTDFNLVNSNGITIRDYIAEEYAFCYMAPEAFAGTCDAKSDQYALGCLAYELITGHLPFAARSFPLMKVQHSYALHRSSLAGLLTCHPLLRL